MLSVKVKASERSQKTTCIHREEVEEEGRERERWKKKSRLERYVNALRASIIVKFGI